MIIWIVGVIGLCQGSLGRENTARTAYSDQNYTRNSLNNGNGQNGIRSDRNSYYNPATNRPPSGIKYLELIDFEDPSGDEIGFRLYMRMDNAEHWNHIMDEATIAVDDGYEVGRQKDG